jgi:pimeloyl-ACP methyl ester carboxylesterase
MSERVVLLHAGIADSRMWKAQAELLRGHGYDVVAPDLPGFGDEPIPPEPFSYVDPIAELLPAALVGNSHGGRVALETALAHADGVHKLVLVSPALGDHDWSPEIQQYWEDEDALVEQGELDAATELTLALFARPAVHETLRPMQLRAYELQAANETPPTWPEARPLSELRAPTLVIVGEQDLDDFHLIAARIAREAPDARVETVADAKHVPSLEAPDAFDRLLLDFLSATP